MVGARIRRSRASIQSKYYSSSGAPTGIQSIGAVLRLLLLSEGHEQERRGDALSGAIQVCTYVRMFVCLYVRMFVYSLKKKVRG